MPRSVVPSFDYNRRSLKQGQPYQIIAKDGDRLLLRDEWQTERIVDAAFKKTVYSVSPLEVAIGERLKWTKNNRQEGRRNGQEFTVKSIEGKIARIESKDGKQETIDFNLPQHLDYAYVSTTYSSQGKTAERVLIATDFTVGLESFYVAVSRVKSDLRIYTGDKRQLLDLAKISRANENPLELLRKEAETVAPTSPSISQAVISSS